MKIQIEEADLRSVLEALETCERHGYMPVRLTTQAITAIRAALAEQAAQQQEPVSTIRALTNQCAALIQERDELQKQVWRYEKNGVTCQTYQHKIERTCSECNVQEDYTSPQPAQQQEPTKAMIDAAERIDWSDSDVRGNIVNMWQAMCAAAQQPAQQQEPVALITPLMEQQMFDDWCPYKGNPDPRTVWAAAIEAVNGLLLGASPPSSKPLTNDTRRLDALAENSWDLRCFDMPTGAGDADIGWRVIEHHMAKPNERTVAEVFRDDPRQAIDAAIEAAHGIKGDA